MSNFRRLLSNSQQDQQEENLMTLWISLMLEGRKVQIAIVETESELVQVSSTEESVRHYRHLQTSDTILYSTSWYWSHIKHIFLLSIDTSPFLVSGNTDLWLSINHLKHSESLDYHHFLFSASRNVDPELSLFIWNTFISPLLTSEDAEKTLIQDFLSNRLCLVWFSLPFNRFLSKRRICLRTCSLFLCSRRPPKRFNQITTAFNIKLYWSIDRYWGHLTIDRQWSERSEHQKMFCIKEDWIYHPLRSNLSKKKILFWWLMILSESKYDDFLNLDFVRNWTVRSRSIQLKVIVIYFIQSFTIWMSINWTIVYLSQWLS